MRQVLTIIIGTSLLTFLMRYLPLRLLHRWTVPTAVERFLYYLPMAVLSALALQSLLLKNGQLNWEVPKIYLIGALASILAGMLTRNIGFSIVAGMATAGLLRLFFL